MKESENAITLRDLGYQLPVPVATKRPSFAFKTWRMPEEKKISEIRARNKNFGKQVRESFDFMLKEFDGQKWDSLDANSRKLLLNQMPFANMFYMWIMLRIDALGEKLKMQDMECPHCQANISKFEADLLSMEVKCSGLNEKLENIPHEPKAVYELKKPIEVGEVTVTKIFHGFTPWDSMERLPSEGKPNMGAVKEQMLKSSYLGAGIEGSDKEVALAKEAVLEALSKRDIEGYYTAIDAHNGGPVLVLNYDCPHCEKEVSQGLNWTYDYFFVSSSR